MTLGEWLPEPSLRPPRRRVQSRAAAGLGTGCVCDVSL